MAAEVIVYSTPMCAPCERLKQYLHAKGVRFVAKDLLMDEEAAEKMEHLGIRSTPVLEIDGRYYSGSELTPESLSHVLGIV